MENVSKIVKVLFEKDGIIACGIIDKLGNILECCAPKDVPKDKLSKVYALEIGMLENLRELFGEFTYRLSKFGKGSQIIYKYGDLYLVASSDKEPEDLLRILEETLKEIKEKA